MDINLIYLFFNFSQAWVNLSNYHGEIVGENNRIMFFLGPFQNGTILYFDMQTAYKNTQAYYLGFFSRWPFILCLCYGQSYQGIGSGDGNFMASSEVDSRVFKIFSHVKAVLFQSHIDPFLRKKKQHVISSFLIFITLFA